MGPIKLFWARGTGGGNGIRNAGDWYSPLICECLSGRRVDYAPPDRCDLVAVGSLLRRLNRSHWLHRLGVRRRLDIWGTGTLRADDRLAGRHRVHAVRGALTRDRLDAGNATEVLGDPGLLAARLVPPASGKRFAVGLVAHAADRSDPAIQAFLAAHPTVTDIDITSPVTSVLEQISACEFVVSSSLHGLVFADAYRVPNAWVVISDRLIGGRHKFDDYYSAFGMRREPALLPDVHLEPVEADYQRPGVDAVSARLESSFPFLR